MIQAVVRNEQPLPDGWWFIPPNVSLEQYLSSGVPSETTRIKEHKRKKKPKAGNAANHVNGDIGGQSDLPQGAASNAEGDENIPLATVAPNLQVATAVIANLLERFPQEFAKFNAKLREYYDAHVPTGNSIGLKNDIRWMINDLFSKKIPGSELYIVGSTVNGCGTPNSDLDMCLVAEDADGGHPSDKQFVMDTLSVVKRTLLSDYRKRFWNVKLVPHATVPIITFDVLIAGFVVHVDINVNQLFGIRNSSLLLLYAKIDKRFSILCVLVRQWAKVKGIGNARYGGLNSYTLNLLVLHYLTFASDPPILPNLQKIYPHLWDPSAKLCAVNKTNLPQGLKWKQKNKKTLGELVLGFFDYFAHFDFDAYGISTAEGYPMEREKFPSAMQKYNVIVMDPFEPVNAARTVFKKSHPVVLYAFRTFVLDVFGESVLLPRCDSPSDDGAMETAGKADHDRQEAEHCVQSGPGIFESQVVSENHHPSDDRTNGHEMIVHQENGESPNHNDGVTEKACEADANRHEAKHCADSDRGIDETEALSENHHPSDVRINGSEMIVHQENGKPPNDAGEVGTSAEANVDLPEAEHCVQSYRGIAESLVSEGSHDHSDVRIDGSELVLDQENGESLNDAGDVGASAEANVDLPEAEHCVQSYRGIAESLVSEGSHDHSDVRTNGTEMIVHHDNDKPPNEAGEVDSPTGVNDDLPEAAHCVQSDRNIAEAQVAEESRHHRDVRINESEAIVHQENVAAYSSVAACSGQEQITVAVTGPGTEGPSSADRPKKAGRSRLSKLRKHCWCL